MHTQYSYQDFGREKIYHSILKAKYEFMSMVSRGKHIQQLFLAGLEAL